MRVFLPFCASFNGERIGFRARRVCCVWYPRRGFWEIWLWKLGASKINGRWFFTRKGYYVFSGGMQ
jgi:hypothetical protein